MKQLGDCNIAKLRFGVWENQVGTNSTPIFQYESVIGASIARWHRGSQVAPVVHVKPFSKNGPTRPTACPSDLLQALREIAFTLSYGYRGLWPAAATAGDTGTGRLKLRNGRFQQLLRHLLRRAKR